MLKVKDATHFVTLFWLVNLKTIDLFQEDCNIISSPNATNTTKNCYILLSCETSGADCNLDIIYKEDDWTRSRDIDDTYCTNSEDATQKICNVSFERSCEVWCVAPGFGKSDPVRINVLEHLDNVDIVRSVNFSGHLLWERPYTDRGIELEYHIVFMYNNGTIIDNVTRNLPKYLLPRSFDKCEFVFLTVVAKTSCGNVSSGSSNWTGSVLRPSLIPEGRFKVGLEQVKGGVSVSMLYLENSSCPSARALSANLSCYYKIMESEETYQLDVIGEGENVFLVDTLSNESVVLVSNEKAQCELISFNENGGTKQWTKNISTFAVQDFNITKVNKTHICMEAQLLNGTTFQSKYRVTLNNTNEHDKLYSYDLNIPGANTEDYLYQCHKSLIPNGEYRYCVSLSGDHYCIFASCVNVTDGADNPNSKSNHSIVIVYVLVSILGIAIAVAIVLAIVIAIVRIVRSRIQRGDSTDFHAEVNRGVRRQSPTIRNINEGDRDYQCQVNGDGHQNDKLQLSNCYSYGDGHIKQEQPPNGNGTCLQASSKEESNKPTIATVPIGKVASFAELEHLVDEQRKKSQELITGVGKHSQSGVETEYENSQNESEPQSDQLTDSQDKSLTSKPVAETKQNSQNESSKQSDDPLLQSAYEGYESMHDGSGQYVIGKQKEKRKQYFEERL